jgi:hypothetical protein
MTRKITEEGAEKRGPRRRAVRMRDKKDAKIIIRKVVNLALSGEIGAERARAVLYGVHIFIRASKPMNSDGRRGGRVATDPAQFAARIREAMREASDQVPPPPPEAE